MTLIEEKTLADHDINVRSIRQELQLLEEQLKKHGRNESSTVTTDTDTISRQAVLDEVDAITKWSLLDRNGCHVGVGMKYRDVKETVKSLPPSPTPSRPHIASLETPCDDCDVADKCTYESNCPREAIWKAEHKGGAV